MLHPLRPSCTFIRACVTAVAALSGALSGTAAAATGPDGYPVAGEEVPSPITDHFDMRISYFRPSLKSELRVDPSGEPLGGTPLSGQTDLGWPVRANQGRLELAFRLRERNRMRVDYLNLGLSGAATLTNPVIFGGTAQQPLVFAKGSEVTSSVSWRMMGFTYTRSFIRTSHFELGAGLGIHLLDADAMGAVPAQVISHEVSAAGAFPTLAVDGIWRISRRFAFTARGQYFGTTIHGFTGALADYHGDLQYRWSSPFAIGIGYSEISVKYQSLTQGTPGRYYQQLRGPEAFVRISF